MSAVTEFAEEFDDDVAAERVSREVDVGVRGEVVKNVADYKLEVVGEAEVVHLCGGRHEVIAGGGVGERIDAASTPIHRAHRKPARVHRARDAHRVRPAR